MEATVGFPPHVPHSLRLAVCHCGDHGDASGLARCRNCDDWFPTVCAGVQTDMDLVNDGSAAGISHVTFDWVKQFFLREATPSPIRFFLDGGFGKFNCSLGKLQDLQPLLFWWNVKDGGWRSQTFPGATVGDMPNGVSTGIQ